MLFFSFSLYLRDFVSKFSIRFSLRLSALASLHKRFGFGFSLTAHVLSHFCMSQGILGRVSAVRFKRGIVHLPACEAALPQA